VAASWEVTGEKRGADATPPIITMSTPVRQAMNLLREFMFQQVYLPLGRTEEAEAAREIIRLLYHHFVHHPGEIPPVYFCHEETPQEAAIDYLAGMTDHYAIRLAEGLQPGISRDVFARVPLV
jgi:dGTPase